MTLPVEKCMLANIHHRRIHYGKHWPKPLFYDDQTKNKPNGES
jgi:hypothetical protein